MNGMPPTAASELRERVQTVKGIPIITQ